MSFIISFFTKLAYTTTKQQHIFFIIPVSNCTLLGTITFFLLFLIYLGLKSTSSPISTVDSH